MQRNCKKKNSIKIAGHVFHFHRQFNFLGNLLPELSFVFERDSFDWRAARPTICAALTANPPINGFIWLGDGNCAIADVHCGSDWRNVSYFGTKMVSSHLRAVGGTLSRKTRHKEIESTTLSRLRYILSLMETTGHFQAAYYGQKYLIDHCRDNELTLTAAHSKVWTCCTDELVYMFYRCRSIVFKDIRCLHVEKSGSVYLTSKVCSFTV